MSELSSEQPQNRGLVALAVLVGVAINMLLQWSTLEAVWRSDALFDSDDAMRLVEVRDFLAGQSWFDLVQHRVDPPAGLLMHWSRFIDAPLAAGILLLRSWVGAPMAETLVRLIWPSLLYAGFLWVFIGLSRRLAGTRTLWPAVLLASTALVFTMQFAPGRIDHHSVQMLLALLVTWMSALAFEAPGRSWLAGLLSGMLLAIGLEALHVVALCGAALGLLWVLRGQGEALIGFALALAGTVTAAFVVTTPASAWFAPACDAMSIALVVAVAGAALLALLLVFIGVYVPAAVGRLLVALVGGSVLIAGLMAAFPACRGGPYGQIEPLVWQLWLSQVKEARGVLALRMDESGLLISLIGLWGAGMAALAVALWRENGPERRTALLLLVLGGVSFLLAMTQVRAMGYATIFALTGGVWAVAQASRAALWRGAVALTAFLPFTWSIIGYAVGGEGAPPASGACLHPAAFAPLAEQPAGRIIAPVDLGSHILAYTPHSVFGAPYHRNQAGIRTALLALTEPEGMAKDIIVRQKAAYVALCPLGADTISLVAHAPQGLAAQLAGGQVPAWLDPVAGTGPIKLWRVKPD